MIYGVGTDIIEVKRIRETVEHYGERFTRRVFTDAEYQYCLLRSESARYPSLAARFAAKEAFVKALGTGIGKCAEWTNIEVRIMPHGKPMLHLHGAARHTLEQMLSLPSIHLTLSHTAQYATAVVVIEES
jgi:holo-[acyl-carrier protein] synthase